MLSRIPVLHHSSFISIVCFDWQAAVAGLGEVCEEGDEDDEEDESGHNHNHEHSAGGSCCGGHVE